MKNSSKFEWKDLGLGPVRSLDTRVTNRVDLDVVAAQQLLSVDAKRRYRLCMEAIARCHEIWTIWEDDQLLDYGDNPSWIPIFPCRQIALLSSKKEEAVSFVPIPVDDFVNDLIGFLSENNIALSIFPSPNQDDVILIDWRVFLVDLIGAWEALYDVEAKSSPVFEEFAYRVVKERINSNSGLS